MKLGISGGLTQATLRSPLTPLFLLAALAVGLIALLTIRREEDPQIHVPMVDVMVSADGLRAADAAELVTKPLETILTAARTLQFFSPGQVLSIQGAGTLKEPDVQVLAAYLEHPAPQTTLILEADDLKGASELQKLVKAKGTADPFSQRRSPWRGRGVPPAKTCAAS